MVERRQTGNALQKPAFTVAHDKNPRYPVLVSIPHAGRIYPPEIYDNLAVPAASLIRLEDRYVDLLAAKAVQDGFATITAHYPRAWIDLNRDRSEIDTDMVAGMDRSQAAQPSRKVRGGLGLIPRRLNGTGNLWRRKWSEASIANRIAECHEPYHQKISLVLQQMQHQFGGAILLDLHSMPPLDENDQRIDMVIGDRFGKSAGGRFCDHALSFLNRAGCTTRLNHPYAGGYILNRHSDPQSNIHALQIEVDRRCYLDADLREPGKDLASAAETIAGLVRCLSGEMLASFQLDAAE